MTVTVTLQSSGSGKKATRKFTNLGGSYTYYTARSQFIMSQALPIMRQEFLAAQSAKIQMVSGASFTSEAFIQSLQSALLKAHAERSDASRSRNEGGPTVRRSHASSSQPPSPSPAPSAGRRLPRPRRRPAPCRNRPWRTAPSAPPRPTRPPPRGSAPSASTTGAPARTTAADSLPAAVHPVTERRGAARIAPDD